MGVHQKIGNAKGDSNSAGIGVYGYAPFSTGYAYAGYFAGNVHVAGTLTKSSGSFKIDHPLAPENRYLSHSFVESPDMKNIYDGVILLDDKGEAWRVITFIPRHTASQLLRFT